MSSTFCQCSSHRYKLITIPPNYCPDGEVPFRPAWALGVPETPGVYLIHDLRGVLYIGRAGNLRRRFEQHYLASHNSLLELAVQSPVGEIEYSWICRDHLEEQRALERALIRSFRPLCNIQHNR